MKPKISFIAPSHRTHMWRLFYDSIITNLDFEVIFVTDKEPKPEEIPGTISKGGVRLDDFKFEQYKNFKWIYSTVKPAQGFQIAYYESTGDYIVYCGDDYFYSPYAIDNALIMHKSLFDHRAMISFRIHEDGNETTHTHAPPWNGDIQLTTSALISRQAIEEVGGLADNNYICGIWDVDLMFRIYAKDGKVYICPTAAAYEAHNLLHRTSEANFATVWQEEMEYLKSCWTINGKHTWERQKPFMPFSKENILTMNQGKTGGLWK